MRFLPSGYLAPHRVAHDLTARQREILHILAQKESMSLREIRARISAAPSDRTLQQDLAHLKTLGLIDAEGRGRGAPISW